MKLTKTILTAAALALATTGAMAEDIKIGYTSLTENVANFVAIDKGFFEKHGINAEAVRLRGGSVVVPGLVSGEIQIGTLTSPTFVQALDGGLDLRVLRALSETNNGDVSSGLIVGDKSGINTPADLVGKTLGVGTIGGMITVAARHFVAGETGIAPDSIKLIEAPMPQLGDLLRKGSFDYTVLPEPLLSRAINGGGIKQIASPFAALPEGKATMLDAVAGEWADANPELAARAKMAIDEATVWSMANNAEAQEITAKYLGLDPEKVKKSKFPILSEVNNPESVQWWVGVMETQGALRTEVDTTKAFIK